jgi:putative transposase
MDRVGCGSAAAERPERTARGYRRFRCRRRGEQFNERSAGALKRARYTSDAIALVVLWRLRCRLTLRDLSEMFLLRGIVSSHEALREWEAKLTPSFPRNSGSVAVGLVVPAVAPGSWKRLT